MSHTVVVSYFTWYKFRATNLSCPSSSDNITSVYRTYGGIETGSTPDPIYAAGWITSPIRECSDVIGDVIHYIGSRDETTHVST